MWWWWCKKIKICGRFCFYLFYLCAFLGDSYWPGLGMRQCLPFMRHFNFVDFTIAFVVGLVRSPLTSSAAVFMDVFASILHAMRTAWLEKVDFRDASASMIAVFFCDLYYGGNLWNFVSDAASIALIKPSLAVRHLIVNRRVSLADLSSALYQRGHICYVLLCGLFLRCKLFSALMMCYFMAYPWLGAAVSSSKAIDATVSFPTLPSPVAYSGGLPLASTALGQCGVDDQFSNSSLPVDVGTASVSSTLSPFKDSFNSISKKSLSFVKDARSTVQLSSDKQQHLFKKTNVQGDDGARRPQPFTQYPTPFATSIYQSRRLQPFEVQVPMICRANHSKAAIKIVNIRDPWAFNSSYTSSDVFTHISSANDNEVIRISDNETFQVLVRDVEHGGIYTCAEDVPSSRLCSVFSALGAFRAQFFDGYVANSCYSAAVKGARKLAIILFLHTFNLLTFKADVNEPSFALLACYVLSTFIMTVIDDGTDVLYYSTLFDLSYYNCSRPAFMYRFFKTFGTCCDKIGKRQLKLLADKKGFLEVLKYLFSFTNVFLAMQVLFLGLYMFNLTSVLSMDLLSRIIGPLCAQGIKVWAGFRFLQGGLVVLMFLCGLYFRFERPSAELVDNGVLGFASVVQLSSSLMYKAVLSFDAEKMHTILEEFYAVLWKYVLALWGDHFVSLDAFVPRIHGVHKLLTEISKVFVDILASLIFKLPIWLYSDLYFSMKAKCMISCPDSNPAIDCMEKRLKWLDYEKKILQVVLTSTAKATIKSMLPCVKICENKDDEEKVEEAIVGIDGRPLSIEPFVVLEPLLDAFSQVLLTTQVPLNIFAFSYLTYLLIF